MRLALLFARPTLRSQLTVQAGFIILIAALISAASFLFFTVREDREDMNGALLHKARAMVRILGNAHSDQESTPLLKTLLAAETEHYLAEIRNPSGHIRLLATHSVVPFLISPGQPLPTQFFYETKPDVRRRLRVLYFPHQGSLIAIAARQESLNEAIRNALLLVVILAALLLVITYFGGRWLASRALAPITELADVSSRITSFETNQRLPVLQADEEIHRLASVLNAMLDRLQASFTLVRRFTADAAHEIKTPLAIIQGHLESTLQSATFAPREEDTLLLVQKEVARLHRLVEGLLLLSRSDAGQLHIDATPLDFSAFLTDLLADAEILAAPLGLTVTSSIPPEITVHADASQLRQVFLNLLDNACKYNHPGGTVDIQLSSEFQRIHTDITNTGPAIPTELVPHLFERLRRGDASRSHSETTPAGFGLGLSIAREIILAHGGEIALMENATGLTTFRVTLFNRPV